MNKKTSEEQFIPCLKTQVSGISCSVIRKYSYVSLYGKNKTWVAYYIHRDSKKRTSIGYYNQEDDAARAVNIFARDAYGIEEPINNVKNPFSVSVRITKSITK